MGLLSQQQPMQQPMGGAPMGGGLLGGMPQQPQAQPHAIELATALSQNPTPQMVQQVIAQIKQIGSPELPQIEQTLNGLGNDPQKIKQFADQMIQKLSGGGNA